MTAPPIIDAWIQHPTLRMMHEPMFASLLRWTKGAAPTTELPVAATIAALDQAGVGQARPDLRHRAPA